MKKLGHDFGAVPMGMHQVAARARRRSIPEPLIGYDDDEQQPHETPQLHVARELLPGDRIVSYPTYRRPWLVLRTPRAHLAAGEAA